MKMRNKAQFWSAAMAILMAGCMHQSGMNAPLPAEGADAFRVTLWQERQLDLLVQAGLMIAGALGVAALLPSGDEDK